MSQELTELILEGATLVRHGNFTLAVEKAQEKLKKFQLPDPRYYIGQFIQALVASGATTISVESADQRVTIQFDGPGYSRSELERIGDAVFESGKHRHRDRLRELALGLLSVQGLHPRKVEIASQGHCWRAPNGLRSSPAERQEILIEHSRKDTREGEILRQQCQSTSIDIRFNGGYISSESQSRTSCPWPNFAFSGENFRGAFGIAYGDIPASTLVLTRYGVVFSRRSEPRIQPSLVVELEHDSLRKNASQSDVVEDENYSLMLAQLQAVQLRFAIKLASQRIPPYQAEQVRSYLHQVAGQCLSHELLRLPMEALGPLEKALVEANLFQCTDQRRRNALELWETMARLGCLFYCSDQKARFHEPGAPVLVLDSSSMVYVKNVFPELTPLDPNHVSAWKLRIQEQRMTQARALPPVLMKKSITGPRGTTELAILGDCPLESQHAHLLWMQGEKLENITPLLPSPLGFAILSQQAVRLDASSLGKILQQHVGPLYEELALDLAHSCVPSSRWISALERVVQWFLWKWTEPSSILACEEWKERKFLELSNGQPVSLADLEAWLEVYPSLVTTYVRTLQPDDFALQVTPTVLDWLGRVFGPEHFVLADLTQPRMVERAEQSALVHAAERGVTRIEKVDEEAELEQIRQEIEAAREGGGLQISEDLPLDEEEVLRELGLQTGNLSQDPPPLPNFVQECLKATKGMGTRWITKFALPGLEGQLLVHEGAFVRPLQPDRLLFKVADNDPVALDLGFLGVSGWLYVPPHWDSHQDTPLSAIRPDFDNSEPEQEWPYPELPFELGMPRLNQELIWTLRRLFKHALYQVLGQTLSAIHDLWTRRLLKLILWDEAWCLGHPESGFAEVPLIQNLVGETFTINALKLLDCETPLYWVGLESGQVADPRHTLRLLPPLTPERVQVWVGRELTRAELLLEDDPAQQLLFEVRQHLVQTCEVAQAPLEPLWLDGLQFGQPSAWVVGPKKYFIQHDAQQGSTRLNPANKLFPQLFRQRGGWNERLPVLASAIYTAINRALHEVEDEHEMAYLEAMLKRL